MSAPYECVFVKNSWFKHFVYIIIPQLEKRKQIFVNYSNNFNSNVLQEIFRNSVNDYSDFCIPQNLIDYCFNDITKKDARKISEIWIKFIEIKKKQHNENNE